MNTFPAPAYSALCQWTLRVSGVPFANSAIILRAGCEPSRSRELLAELERLHAEFQTTPNQLWGSSSKIAAAYKALKIHELSGWEQTELEVQEGIASGRYREWSTAGRSQVLDGPREDELLLLVVHGGIELARPLLLRYAEVHWGTIPALWARWIATGQLDVAEARRLAGEPSSLPKSPSTVHIRLPLFFLEPEPARAREALAHGAAPKDREPGDKPVKTLPKLLAQLIAFWEGKLSREVLEKSFAAWFAYCYHPESPSNLPEKIGPAFLYGRYLEPLPAHVLVERIKQHLPMFSEKRRKARAPRVADVRAVMEPLEAAMGFLSRGEGLRISPEGSPEVVLGPWGRV
ncbi:hypothetical protein ACN28E_51540 [Archangium lansingense]|uniref:hypothetical protein n=1 Tax=Archangium lansingense TaxID=2995310 RepID=UPI003B7CE596